MRIVTTIFFEHSLGFISSNFVLKFRLCLNSFWFKLFSIFWKLEVKIVFVEDKEIPIVEALHRELAIETKRPHFVIVIWDQNGLGENDKMGFFQGNRTFYGEDID